jgi:threonyl-tRNA synthetase
MKVRLPNGKWIETEDGRTALELLREHEPKWLKTAVAVRWNGQIVDLTRPLHGEGALEVVTFDDPEGREVFWHSSSHLMAQAVKELFPEARLAIGPPIEDGFYYDIDLDRSLGPEDLQKLEEKMKELASQKLRIQREELPKDEAVKLFSDLNETYKVEILQEMEDEDRVSVYRQGNFVDLCRGPHLPDTGYIKHFKLLNVAGAYWRGDEKNKMLQRIYGVAFPKKSQLEEHLHLLEEAKKRDHRRLGRELDLFSISEEIGPGLILWHPKGAFIRHLIESFWKEEHFKAGYELLYTPHIAKLDLWRRSGHVDFYRENMYAPMVIDDVEYELKPMNCPFHITIYKSKIRSYRELPIRWAELGTVYRYERSGVLHGMLRVRGFTQDDAHIFCRPDQIQEEILRLLDFTMFFLRTFGFTEYEIFLSTRPEKYVGTEENWELATNALKQALEIRNLEYEIDPGEGVFYGPKIDIKIRDALKRYWQCTTIQVDFNNPERFDVQYIGDDGQPHRPIMIHRALLGSLERFFGILIEHYGGAFPVWLSPTQVVVIPITDRQHEYAQQCHDQLIAAGIRSALDSRNEKVGYKIREAETQKIPYMLVIGDREVQSEQVAVRQRRVGDIGQMALHAFIEKIKKEVAEKSLET